MEKNKIEIKEIEESGKPELIINGLHFTANEDYNVEIPVSVVKDISISDFPSNTVIAPTIDSNHRGRPYLNPQILNLGNGKARVNFFHCLSTEEILHSNIGHPLFQETLAELLLLKSEFNPEILDNYYDVENQTFHLHCSIELNTDTIQHLIYETEEYFYSFAALVVTGNNEKLREFLRTELGLDPNPSETAKIEYLFPEDTLDD